jgi:hypothetical protein
VGGGRGEGGESMMHVPRLLVIVVVAMLVATLVVDPAQG